MFLLWVQPFNKLSSRLKLYHRAIPKTWLVLGMALGKAAKSPLFPLNLRLLSQKLKFWESLNLSLFYSKFRFLSISTPAPNFALNASATAGGTMAETSP
jgi:hypothetical protein